jgi:6-phosphogluconolactonase
MSTHIIVKPTPEDVALRACDWLVARIGQCIKQKERCVISLSGGSTPKRLYQLLADLPEGTVDWTKVHLIWGDERNVPLDDQDSNFLMVRETLLDRLGKNGPNVYPMPIEVDQPMAVAERYDATLRALLGETDLRWPRIDVVLLGLGDDAHTASLFPGTDILYERTKWVASCWVAKLGTFRISITPPVINSADAVMFLVCGEKKRQALQQIWHAANNPSDYPAQLISPVQGELWWILDDAALERIELPKKAIVEE